MSVFKGFSGRTLRNAFGKNKVEGYKNQDKVADREIDEDTYINEHWCLNQNSFCRSPKFKDLWIFFLRPKIPKPLENCIILYL